MTALAIELDIEGTVAPPRANGELVFTEPWESRVFGITVSMSEAGYFKWPAFQAALASAISDWGVDDRSDPSTKYYRCWLQALEVLLEQLGHVNADQIRDRIEKQRSHTSEHIRDHAD